VLQPVAFYSTAHDMHVFREYMIWTGLMQEETEVHHLEFPFSLSLLNLL